MPKDIENRKSLLEQIQEEMFTIISKQSEFDAKIIKNLKGLVKNEQLRNYALVIDAIKATEGKDNEDT